MNKFKGIGLLELMLALAIISVLLVAATRYFVSTDSSRKVNDAANMLQAVINASEDWRTTKNSYDGVSLANLKAQGLLPDWGDTSNPWGGGIEVNSTTTPGKITMTLHKVRKEDCNSLSDLMKKKGVAQSGTCGVTPTTDYVGTYSS